MYIMVDVEADGPCPGLYSMIAIGAVVVNDRLDKTFYGELRPVTEKWQQEALDVVGVSREETLQYPEAAVTMWHFYDWLKELKSNRLMFVSDNNGFDWQFINYYFWQYCGGNPFGFSSTNLGSLYKGMRQTVFENFKHLRDTKHTHDPVDDARGNAEALLKMKADMGLKISFE